MAFKTMLSCLGVMFLCVAAPSWAGGPWTPMPPDEAPSDVAVAWFDLLYDLVKAEQVTPPPGVPDLRCGGSCPLRSHRER
jgi:hypothetical protein